MNILPSSFSLVRGHIETDPVVENPIYEEAFQQVQVPEYNPRAPPPPVPPPRSQQADRSTYQQPRNWMGFPPPPVKNENTYENSQAKRMDVNTYENQLGRRDGSTYENPYAIIPPMAAPNVRHPAGNGPPGEVYFNFNSK